MADTFLISGLKKLRAEKLGDLDGVKERMRVLEAEAAQIETVLGHIDGVLKEVAPEEKLENIKPVRTNRSRGHAPTGRTSRRDGIGGVPVPTHVLQVMRREGLSMTAVEIVDRVMALRPSEKRPRIDRAVRSYLRVKVEDGLLDRQDGEDGTARFSIAA